MAKKIFRGLMYSQVWEDADLATGALEPGPGDDLLVVTSAGDLALALALRKPHHIVAIDVNPLQNDLFELKRAAIAVLTHDELLELAGVRPSVRRRALYRKVRRALPVPIRAVWDARPDVIKQGWIFAGSFDRYMRLFARFVLPLIHSRRDIDALLQQPDLPTQRRFYRDVWDNRRWRLLFRIFFGRLPQRLIGRSRDIFTYAPDLDIGTVYLDRAKRGLTEVPVLDNYYLEYLATGRYSETHGLPPYLRAHHQAPLRRLAPRIEAKVAGVRDFLATAPDNAFSGFYLSDVFDYLSPEDTAAVFRDLVRVGRPGARLCYYQNLIERRHPPELDGQIETLTERSAELFARSRACFYGGFVVEQVVK